MNHRVDRHRFPTAPTVCLALATLAGPGTPLGGQEVVVVAGDESYCDCRVALEHVVTLGDTVGPGTLPNSIRTVSRNSEGVYHVLAWRDHRILRFSSDGNALPPLLHEGQGPGEATGVSHFILVSDSIFAFDPRQGRVTVLDPAGEYVRTFALPQFVYAAATLAGHLVVNGPGSDPRSSGLPLHVVAPDGEVLRSFGGERLAFPGRDVKWLRNVAAESDVVWSAPQNRYTLGSWSGEGEARTVLQREAEWFPPRDGRSWGADRPMPPWITGIAEDARGYLRVSMIRGGPRWAELLPPPIGMQFGEPLHPVPPGIGLFETVLEVIDPESGRLIAAGVVEPEVYGFVDPDHVFSYAEDERGNPSISIWRIHLAAR